MKRGAVSLGSGTDRPPLSGEEPRGALPGGAGPGVRATGGFVERHTAGSARSRTVLPSATDGGGAISSARRAKSARRWLTIGAASVLAVALLVGVRTGWFVNSREPLILNQATTEQITFNPAEEPIFLAAISPDNK